MLVSVPNVSLSLQTSETSWYSSQHHELSMQVSLQQGY